MTDNIVKYGNSFNIKGVKSQIALDGNVSNFKNENMPLSFKDWLIKHTGIAPGKEYYEYNSYLKSWYSESYSKDTVQTEALRNDYINLLKQLSLIFKDDDNLKFISEVNFDDNVDIEYAIPYYTKKLKEIAFYIVKKRDSLKNAKLKYNMAGANQSIEKLFYQYLLQAFTNKNSIVEVPEFSAVSILPDLSAINTRFSISVEEIYDEGSYFDKDPSTLTNPITSNCINKENEITDVTNTYFDSLNYAVSTNPIEWIFQSGYMNILADNPLLWTLQTLLDENLAGSVNDLPKQTVDLNDIDNPVPNEYNLMYLNKKYLGNDMYIISGGYYVLDTITTSSSFVIGNNWLYWPQGEFKLDNYNVPLYNPIQLSASKLVQNGAIADSDYRNSDKIFVQNDNGTKGAWLKHVVTTTEQDQMSCALVSDSITTFRFPYCNFGFVGDGDTWSGRTLNNINSEYNYLDDDLKRKTDLIYWNTISSKTLQNIEINDTTLAANGAHGSQYFVTADKITKRKSTDSGKIYDSNRDSVYTDGFESAWLYQPIKTDLPIKTSKNEIIWPLVRLSDPTASTIKIDSDFCQALPLVNIPITNFLGTRAGYGLADSDIIYKLNSKNSYPVEVAFLQGKLMRESLPSTIKVVESSKYSTTVSTITGIMQVGLTHRCNPDSPETFIWQDSDTTIDSLNVNYVKHQDDCPYKLYSEHPSVYKQKDNKEFDFKYNWKDCNCKSIVYSPIGHIGTQYEDYNGMTDIIFLDNTYPDNFSFKDWRGSDGKTYKESSDFAWFKISKTTDIQNNDYGFDVDVGVGIGSWVTGSGESFTFKQGKQYKYIRSGMGRSKNELVADYVPYLILSKLYNNEHKPSWKKAVYDPVTTTWVETTLASDLILNAGDYITYDHFDSDFYCLKFQGSYKSYDVTTYNQSAVNTTNNNWVNYTYATTGIALKYTWPNIITNTTNNPSLLGFELSSVTWSVSSVDNTIASYRVDFAPTDKFTIIPNLPDTLMVNATGYSDKGIYIANNIGNVQIVAKLPNVTPTVSGAYDIKTIYADTINFILNADINNCKPFWGEASYDNDLNTKNKGVSEWGVGLRVADDYTFIHQPPASRMILEAEDVISYDKKSTSITWEQPITFNALKETKTWSKLNFIGDKQSPLSSYFKNVDFELVVYPTDEVSDIAIKPYDYINYYATEAFTWVEELSDTTKGVPPYGGIYVPYTSALAIESLVPYANLTNRHYPSIAVYPNVKGFFNEGEFGGYFIPSMLGINTYLGKKYVNSINLEFSSVNVNKTDILFRNPDIFVSNDIGLTDVRQNGPIINDSNDSSWMKASVMEGNKAGEIKNAALYKEFIPYQTKEETVFQDINGIIKRDDDIDPWYGEFDNSWKDVNTWPANFRNEHRISDWYANNNLFIKQVNSVILDDTITIKAPEICDGNSRFIYAREVIDLQCNNCNNIITSLSTFNITTFSETVTSNGSLIIDVNGTMLNNFHIPLSSSANIGLSSIDQNNIFYGDHSMDSTITPNGYLNIMVNLSSLYIKVYKGRRTQDCVSELSGTFIVGGNFTSQGFATIMINDEEKAYIELHQKI